ncbi:MAG: HEAT repeat domain-containing protein [Anaerolineae bacterium]
MINDSECVTFEEALVRLADEDVPLSSPVLYALSGPTSEEVRLFGRQWPTLSLERRRKIIALLAESAEANFELDFNDLFRVTMTDEDEHVRTVSIEGLWEDDEVTLIAPLVHALRHDTAVSVRAAAASSLGRFVLMAELEELDERYACSIRAALLETIGNKGEHVEVRRRAVESIAYLGEDYVREIIAAAYQEAEESMRISAIFAMGRSADKSWARIVQAELSNANPAIRYEAARACGELEVKEAVPALIRLASDPDREVQFAAIVALGQIGGTRARRFLERCCRSKDEIVRLAAEDALAELEWGQQPLDLFIYEVNEEEKIEPEEY